VSVYERQRLSTSGDAGVDASSRETLACALSTEKRNVGRRIVVYSITLRMLGLPKSGWI